MNHYATALYCIGLIGRYPALSILNAVVATMIIVITGGTLIDDVYAHHIYVTVCEQVLVMASWYVGS